MKLIFIGLVVLGLILAGGWYFISPLFNVIEVDDPLSHLSAEDRAEHEKIMKDMEGVVKEMDDPFSGSLEGLSGDFMASAHEVAGSVRVIDSSEGRILRFEDFETVNGPNLHIYLATDSSASDYVDLGEIRGTKGNVNYELSDDIDLEKYDTVLVWCVPFKVLFSYAGLE